MRTALKMMFRPGGFAGPRLLLNGARILDPAAPLALASGPNTITGSGVATLGALTAGFGTYVNTSAGAEIHSGTAPRNITVPAGSSLASLTAAQLTGAVTSGNFWASLGQPFSAFYFTNDGTTATVQMQRRDDVWIKGHKLQFTLSGTTLTITVLYTKYFPQAQGLGLDMDTAPNGFTQPTNSNSYGMSGLQIGLAPQNAPTSLSINLSSGNVTFGTASAVNVPVSVGGYAQSLIAKLQPSNQANLGSTTVLGTALPTQAGSRTLLSVVNTYLTNPLTQAELDIILANPSDFDFAVAVGDRRGEFGAPVISRFAWVTNWSGADVSNFAVTPEVFPATPYSFRLTFTRAGGGAVTMTDSHASTANTYGSIRGFTIAPKAGVGSFTVTVKNRDALGTGNVSVSGALDIASLSLADEQAVLARTTRNAGGIIVHAAHEYLVVAGGGSGGSRLGVVNEDGWAGAGGGGAGGVLTGATMLSGVQTLTVGAGGTAATITGTSVNGNNGGNSVLGSLTAIGGGAGGFQARNTQRSSNGNAGGSGGGASSGWGINGLGGAATAGQGNAGGTAVNNASGGGGATAAGVLGSQGAGAAGANGGAGITSTITGTSTTYAGGGGGGANTNNGAANGLGNAGTGGAGGGGNGGRDTVAPTSGAANTGGGGGGVSGLTSGSNNGGDGGSGVIVIAYPVSLGTLTIGGGLTFSLDTATRPGFNVYRFTAGTGTVTA